MAKFLGAVVSSGNDDLLPIMELFAHHVPDEVTYIHYETPKEIDCRQDFDFIVCGDIPTIKGTIARCKQMDMETPLIVHLVYNREVRPFNYYQEFPGVDVAPIRQSPLATLDTTLQIDLFISVIESLDARRG